MLKTPSFINDQYETAQNIIKETIFADKAPGTDVDIDIAYQRSRSTLSDYVTLDLNHRADIVKLIRAIRAYADDRTRLRPLNIIMQAEPGAGKSHFVKCLASRLTTLRAAAVGFNMAGLQSIDDLAHPLEAVRNFKVLDKLPILFLDEFDSDPNRYPILLPLLWDGELHVSHRDLKLGKLVIILAGSSRNIDETMKSARGMQTVNIVENNKLIDLLSRINGGELNIPPLDLVEGIRDRRIDKVCIAVSLLQQRFSNSLQLIPWSLLRFVAFTKFRYGVRSIENLLNFIIPPKEECSILTTEDLKMPLDSVERLNMSSLSYHFISEDGPAAIIESWKEALSCSSSVRVKTVEEDDQY